MDLQLIWYLLIGVLLAGYAVLDGYDLGVGALYPFVTRNDREKAALRSAIGPVWDGNEVWLITGAGALFAAFPFVYATVFSGFYLAIMLLLFSLIFRAVSIEYRGKDPRWRRFWDIVFSVSSTLAALLLGVAVGNIVRGVPLTPEGEFDGTLLTLLHPYNLLVGVLTLVLFAVHGAAWGVLRTEGALQLRLARVRSRGALVFAALFLATTAATFFAAPDRVDGVFGSVIGWAALAVVLGGVAFPFLRRDSERASFLASAASVLGLVGLWAVGNYPNLVPALNNPDLSLTTATSSSDLTLKVMLVIALIGVPIVLTYTVLVHWVFSGKVEAETEGEGY